MEAIVYTSNTGSTAQYAQMLGQATGLNVYSLDDAKKKLSAQAEIIYLGWIMASGIVGYQDAAKRYRVRAVCAVGMGKTGSQTDGVREKNGIPADIPLFTLQGNFDVKKLRGVYRIVMGLMVKTTGKALEEKADRTPGEEDMLNMLRG
ncbi:MAG: hypothetical protein ACI4O3_04570, partial [Oscillospiraceae bacterium]